MFVPGRFMLNSANGTRLLLHSVLSFTAGAGNRERERLLSLSKESPLGSGFPLDWIGWERAAF